jgi:putative CocE/NonD family hydrolase
VDVDEDGKAINVTEGILRARYRNSRSAPTLLAPGEPTHMVVDLWATSRVFAKGHRIRLEVASSNFPRFDRNLNTGNPAGSSAAMLKATNAVLHDAAHPTALMLPLVPR